MKYPAIEPVKPWVRSAAELIGTKFDVKTILGFGFRATEGSDHPLGKALDFMTGSDHAKGDAIAEYAQANAAALGVKYIMWNKNRSTLGSEIWSVERAGEGWRQVENRGSLTANHDDHVHVSFNDSPGTGTPTDTTNTGSSSGASGSGCAKKAAVILFAFSGTAASFSYMIYHVS